MLNPNQHSPLSRNKNNGKAMRSQHETKRGSDIARDIFREGPSEIISAGDGESECSSGDFKKFRKIKVDLFMDLFK